ncbi:hypothetical protein D3C79_441750 [compost metagenome]
MQRMANTHRQTALQLARNQLRHDQVATLHNRMMIQQFNLAGSDIHRYFRQRTHGAVIGHSRVITLGWRVINLLTCQGAEFTVTNAYRQAVDRQALAVIIQLEVCFRPLPAVEDVHDCASQVAHLIGFLSQQLKRQYLHPGRRQATFDPASIFFTHHQRCRLATTNTRLPDRQRGRPQPLFKHQPGRFASTVREIVSGVTGAGR